MQFVLAQDDFFIDDISQDHIIEDEIQIKRIFQKVIYQMFTDLISGAKYRFFNQYRREAYEWFFHEDCNNDFQIVCMIAGYNHINIKKIAKRLYEKKGQPIYKRKILYNFH